MTTPHLIPALGAVVLGVALLSATSPVEATRVPLVTSMCSVADFGSVAPSGLTFNSNTSRFASTDDSTDLVTVYDSNCVVDFSFSTGNFGSNAPQGITYNAALDRYAIVDNSADEVFFTTSGGVLLGQCDLAGFGSTSPTGIAYRPGAATYAITDNSADEIFIIDDSQMGGGVCNLLDQFDSLAYGSNAPSAITFVAGANQFAQVDTTADEVFIVDTTFTLDDQFDTVNGFGSTNAEGVVYVGPLDTYYFVDSSLDMLLTIDARGTSEFLCSTVAVGSTSPVDVAFNPGLNEIAFADSGTDTVYIVDEASCGLVRLFNIATLGISAPAGMTYLADRDQLVITDTSDDEVYFVGYTSQSLEGQCDLLGMGLSNTTGVDLIEDLDLLVLTDASDDAMVIADFDCNVIQQNALTVLGNNLDATNSQGIGYQAGLGRFMVVDPTDDEVYLNGFEGLTETHFDLFGLGLGNANGIDALAGGETFLLSATDLDAIYRLHIPGLTTAQSISGRFTATGLNARVVLYERGAGRLSGTFLFGVSELPMFGQYNAAAGTISFGLQLPNGSPRVFSGTVSADLNTITLQGPLGTLNRTF